MSNLPLLDGFYETAYVTREMDAALERLRTREGIAKALTFAPPASKGPVSHIARVAKAFVGERLIEIIEPNPAVKSMFEGYVPDAPGDLRFHHLGYIVKNEADWDALKAKASVDNLTIAYEGLIEGFVKSVFFDTRKELGHYSEYLLNYERGLQLLKDIPRN